MGCPGHFQARWQLPNDPKPWLPLLSWLFDAVDTGPQGLGIQRFRLGLGLLHALRNALFHRNLELAEVPTEETLWWNRRQRIPFRDRRIGLHAQVQDGEWVVRIQDEGPGFRPDRQAGGPGKGLRLMQTVFQKVQFNSVGNQVTLSYRPPVLGRPHSPRLARSFA